MLDEILHHLRLDLAVGLVLERDPVQLVVVERLLLGDLLPDVGMCREQRRKLVLGELKPLEDRELLEGYSKARVVREQLRLTATEARLRMLAMLSATCLSVISIPSCCLACCSKTAACTK